MRIGIDIDDTLTDTISIQKKYWAQYVKDNPSNIYNSILPSNINTFGDPYIDKFWDTYRSQLYLEAPFKDGAAEITEHLKKLGHELVIVTSRQKSKYINLENYLQEFLKRGNINISTIYTDVLDKGKFMDVHDIDILIDDDINHCKSAIVHGKKAILFNKNKDYEGIQVDNWYDIPENLNF